MLTKEKKEEIVLRKNKLEEARVKLKTEFVGLDKIIDEIIEQVRSWYIFPEGQVRPSIINLWGMTGVGKTSLVRRLFDMLDMSDSFFKFDMGEYSSGDSKIKDDFSSKVKNLENEPVAIVFDEFQIGRTIDENGSEVDRKGLRVIWDLLDTGKFDVLNSSWHGKEIYLLFMKMQKFIHEDKIKVENGIVTENGKKHATLFYPIGTSFESYSKIVNNTSNPDENKITSTPSIGSKIKRKKKKKNKDENEEEDLEKTIQYFIPSSLHWAVRAFWEDRFITSYEFLAFLRTLNEEESSAFILETCDRAMKPKLYDFSNSIIFVIGNLDSVYSMSRNSSPDVNADLFYENSLKITQIEIKEALQSRFRIEQIARLGNNHIIYPAFSSKIYNELISLELSKLDKKIKTKFGLNLEFDNSVNDIIYKEGVFPTQGVRPVFTTISSVVESYIGKFVSNLIERDILEDVKTIKWSYKDNNHIIVFSGENNNSILDLSYPVNLKVEPLRQSTNDDNQAFTAVHEAGHAIAMMRTLQIAPKMIRSKTANSSEGFCSSQMPDIHSKSVLKDIIAVSVAGRVSEELIFGEERISSGAGGDISAATKTAMRMLKYLGMNLNGDMIVYSQTEQSNDSQASSETSLINREALILITEQKKRTTIILSEEKVLLLKMSEYLTSNSFMDEEKIIEFFRLYSVDKDMKFLDQESFYPYKDIMIDELEKVDNILKLAAITDLKVKQ